jgi:hypothetical protein
MAWLMIVGVPMVAGHRLMTRPEVVSRVRSRSIPTRGEARKAAKTPPRAGGSSIRLRWSSVRRRAASLSLRTRRLARARIISRSELACISHSWGL